MERTVDDAAGVYGDRAVEYPIAGRQDNLRATGLRRERIPDGVGKA